MGNVWLLLPHGLISFMGKLVPQFSSLPLMKAALSACGATNWPGICYGTWATESSGLLGFLTVRVGYSRVKLGWALLRKNLVLGFARFSIHCTLALVFSDYISPQQGSVTPHTPFSDFHLICDLISSWIIYPLVPLSIKMGASVWLADEVVPLYH